MPSQRTSCASHPALTLVVVGFEYRSPQTVGGLPLLHVAFGMDPYTGRRRVAKGVVAIGQVAYGVVAIGQVAVGLVALGQIAVALAGSVGQIAFGVYVLGQFAAGGAYAVGQFAAAYDVTALLGWAGARGPMILAGLWLLSAISIAARAWPPRRRLARLVDAEVARRLREVRPGAVALEGRVIPIDTLEAPISHRPCVAYDVRRVAFDNALRAEQACTDFWIEDSTGRVRVIAGEPQLFLEPVAGSARAVRRALAHAGGTRAGAPQATTADGTEVLHERVLLPGDWTVVIGHAMKTIDGGDAPSETRRVQALVHGGATGPVMVTNRYLEELRAEASVPLWLSGAMALGAVLLAIV